MNRAGDVRFVDYSGDDGTILHFEAPLFGEAAPKLYEQQEFWPMRPAPEETGFDLLAEVLSEIDAHNEESEVFDRPLLRDIARFAKVFDDHVQSLRLGALAVRVAGAPAFTPALAETAKGMRSATPRPRRVRVAGLLDMIWESRQAFSLRLGDDGADISGSLVAGDIGELKELFNKRVLVEGKAVYRPSRRLLRLDAERIMPAGDIGSVWESVPGPLDTRGHAPEWRVSQSPQSGVNTVIGKWPGDETDEEIFTALEQLS